MVTRAEGYELHKSGHQYVDGTETVSYRIDQADGDTSVKAKRLELSKLAASFNPVDIEEADQPWIVYADTLSQPMQAGAVLIDSASIRYQIRSYQTLNFGTEYHCICSRLPNAR